MLLGTTKSPKRRSGCYLTTARDVAELPLPDVAPAQGVVAAHGASVIDVQVQLRALGGTSQLATISFLLSARQVMPCCGSKLAGA